MSCGGLPALEVPTDPCVSTVIICNSGLFTNPVTARAGMPKVDKEQLAKVHRCFTSWGGEKAIASKNGMDDVQRINHVPIFAANLDVGLGGTYSRPHGGEFGKVAVGWLQWQLRKDERRRKCFAGDPCGLAKQEGWKVEKKNIP